MALDRSQFNKLLVRPYVATPKLGRVTTRVTIYSVRQVVASGFGECNLEPKGRKLRRENNTAELSFGEWVERI